MIVVNNFFKGILKRGIPIYTEELVSRVRNQGEDIIEVSCPKWARNLPPYLLNLIFILYEQVLVPCYGMYKGAYLVIYPYNSISFLDLLTGKGKLIVHDFISFEGDKIKLSAMYVKLCITFASKLSRDVIFISKSTKSDATKLGLFTNSNIKYLPNGFFCFEDAVKGKVKRDEGYILILTGHGENKDFRNALLTLESSDKLRKYKVKIVGFGNHVRLAQKIIDEVGGHDAKGRYFVYDFISFDKVLDLYANCTFVFVHSLHEGYGRAIAEAKLSRKKVICSDIPAFREQKSCEVYYYHDFSSFIKSCDDLLSSPPLDEQYECLENITYNETIKDIINGK
ncbi:hypothetical protein BCT47_20930 [Vibrio splendidus]|uniref:Glycosyltransferase n=1 Tax=Vibrio splendidus TaxID=29497 RepID=A0AB35N250_VIBSP|nr:glycosyltransferase [Vibrio splendidus]MDP2502847.1 glycosyltransferase [Vibrio splendidus]PMG54853.1 hypothetical protein BCU89_14265 [Vibrio splendidus]PMM74652.1 hypothetical protein BCT47_20930 [Vibrio splendidus]